MNFSTRKPRGSKQTPREKFICSMRPRSRNSPARKGSDDRSSLSRRAYLLSSLLNLISRRGRSLVNHSVFRDSSSFRSVRNGYETARPMHMSLDFPTKLEGLSNFHGWSWVRWSARERILAAVCVTLTQVQIIQRLSFDCSSERRPVKAAEKVWDKWPFVTFRRPLLISSG